jgi:hypothetical protein
MRYWRISALSLVLVLGACSRREEKAAVLPDDLKQDLARASAGSDLALSTPGYQRARFVSALEQAHTAQPEMRPKKARTTTHAMVAHQSHTANTTEDAPAPEMVMASAAPQPEATPAAPTPEPAVEAPQPAPSPVQQAGAGAEIAVGTQGHGGGLGGFLGALGGVIIRGGIGSVDKCDPRHEGREGTMVMIGRPDFGTPIGRGTFPGGRRIVVVR